MKYLDANKVSAAISALINLTKSNCLPNPKGTREEKIAAAKIESLKKVRFIIDEMKQDEPSPPGIEEECQRKGWLDYGLMMNEIGLHRYNAIQRIKEHKSQFEILRVPKLYHVAEYYMAVGVEVTCCCLQVSCKDMFFTPGEVKEIIEKESLIV